MEIARVVYRILFEMEVNNIYGSLNSLIEGYNRAVIVSVTQRQDEDMFLMVVK